MSIKTKVKKYVRKLRASDKEQKTEESEVPVEQTDIELKEACTRYADKNRDKVWAFIAGHTSQDFRGNPKYLFVYVNRYRPDITAYWLCSNEDTIEQVRKLGFTAHKLETPAAQYAIDHTGVLVTEQVKFAMPEGFENVKYLNLWHGVGLKHIERKQFMGDISMDLARKYVERGTFYRDHQLMVVTSPTIEKEYVEDCGVDSDKFVRTGYLRCLYQQNFEPICSFEHDLRKVKGLSKTTRMVVYAPTFRAKLGGSFAKAMTDLEALYQCCERNDLLLIFKVHPNMEKEEGFLRAWETYGDRQRFWFWDNQEDFYEIMDQMDMAIIDYSGIFSDMVAVGIKHYIRYIFDYDDYMQDGFTQGDYFDRTAGEVCYTFDDLIHAIDTYDQKDDSSEFKRIHDKLWSYAGGKEDFEKTIQQVLDFKVEERTFPNLYSFDIFDTLFSRKVLDPVGIFYYVKEKIEEYGGFPAELKRHYPVIRHMAEMNVREYYSKSKELRKSDRVEISFHEIFERMRDVYGLNEEQIQLLEKWELEAEYDNVIPLEKQINLIKKLHRKGEKVVLISDMYLPKEFIKKLLEKADPILAELPLFLSSEYGVLKTSQELFFEVYKSFEPFYDFKKWIHWGDNINADQNQARKFRICTRKVNRPEFNDVQKSMVKYLGTYDSYKVAALQARMYENAIFRKDEFVTSFIALCMVPYVDWVLRDAERRGYQTLYFISRDGHPLKRIADAIIQERKLNFKTKYIYASRRTWRIPSFIHEVDEGFFLPYGNFSDLISKEKLFKAMDLDEEIFCKMFPTIDPDKIDFSDKQSVNSLVEIFKDSDEYNKYLLEKAAKERVLVSGYLKQEINPDEKFAVVEYYGRGFTQDCMVRLWQDIVGKEVELPFYYSRSVLPSIGSAIRYNFTTNNTSQYFLESIFANMPYKSIEKYEMKEEKIVPVIVPIQCDKELYDSMQRILPEFAKKYAGLELKEPEATDRALFDFALEYYKANVENETFAENIGTLIDSVALYGKKREYAPAYTMEDLNKFANKELTRGQGIVTTNISMSATRSNASVRERYCELYQILPGDSLDSGRVLSEDELETNREFRAKYEALEIEAENYRQLYEQAIEKVAVENKILFVTNSKSLDNTSVKPVYDALKNQSEVTVAAFCLAKKDIEPEKIIKELAAAKFVVVPHAIREFAKITFRADTKEIMLNNVAFPLYNQGLAVDYFLKWKKRYIRLASTNNISVLQIPSLCLEERFRKNYSLNSQTDCSLLGCCNTDVYFKDDILLEAQNMLYNKFPECKGKKVILYMPTIRTRHDSDQWISMLDMDVLQKLIGNDYTVAVNFNASQYKSQYKNIIEIPGFSKIISKDIPLRWLMMVADIIIGDYRDTFFESALLNKPVYFTVYDYEQLIKSRNMDMGQNFEEFIFGPVITTSLDLAKELKQVDTYDYSNMKAFRNKMLSGCDGKSVERVVDYLLDHTDTKENDIC